MSQAQSVMQTYARLPVSFTGGEGVWVWDEAGTRYLDALGGIAVSVLGHAHPRIVAAIEEAGRTVIHTSNLYNIQAQETAGRLPRGSERSGADLLLQLGGRGQRGGDQDRAPCRSFARFRHAEDRRCRGRVSWPHAGDA